jgi:methylthioribose-1-phosphate isomerase
VKVRGQHFRTIWLKPDDETVVQLIDQRFLPHQFVIEEVRSVRGMATAIREMHVRGAGLIGASAGYGMYLATIEAAASSVFDQHLTNAAAELKATRPTAVNLSWAIERQLKAIGDARTREEKIRTAGSRANVAVRRRRSRISADWSNSTHTEESFFNFD